MKNTRNLQDKQCLVCIAQNALDSMRCIQKEIDSTERIRLQIEIKPEKNLERRNAIHADVYQ